MDSAFIEFLMNQGAITPEQVKKVKEYMQTHQKDFVTALVELNILSQREIFKYKALFFNIPFIDDIFSIKIPDKLREVIKKYIDTVNKTRSFPFDYDAQNRTVKVVAKDYLNYNIKQIWKVLLKAEDVQIYTTYPDDLERYIIQQFSEFLQDETIKEIEEYTQAQSKATSTSEELNLEATSTIAKFVNTLLEYAVDHGASDIHIEPMVDHVRFRFRIDGVLVQRFKPLPKRVLPELISRIKILAKLRIDETRKPQDGRIFVKIKGKEFDLRVATSPTIHGEKAVIRLLPKDSKILSIEQTGMRGKALEDFKRALRYTAGIILITGPTGSGKTTTLATALHYLNKPEVNIISIEDPVEIIVPGVTQIQVNPQIGLTFANILRSVLRQDPDIIMVGEIRDEETAELAIQAALTGHLVLSTLHTNDAASAFVRLMEMGIQPYLLTSTVKVVVSQRLVRTICPYSRKPYIPPIDVQMMIIDALKILPNFDIYKYLEELAKKRPQNKDPSDPTFRLEPPVLPPRVDPQTGRKEFYLYKGEPHPKCSNLPYKGRTGIFEVLWNSDEIKKAVLQRKSAKEIAEIAIREGMIPLYQEGLLKTIEGITTLEEVERVAIV